MESRPSRVLNTWAFFVNAAGEKEDPIIIGKYAKPRCFKNVKDIKRPYGCWYYSNSEAWMNTKIMKEVLTRLNEKLKRRKQNILMLMDNAPCHPHSIAFFFRRTQRQKRSLLMLASLQTGRLNISISFCDMFAPR